jgi:dsRNA-specific ribonuclease
LTEAGNEWKRKKEVEKIAKTRDVDKYVNFSFKKDFKMNNKDIELFEGPKMLADVFESIMGAVFIDNGIETVLQVYKDLLAPFILHVAKYSKKLHKEPKEDFVILSGINKIKPEFEPKGEKQVKLNPYVDGETGLESYNIEVVEPEDQGE